MTEWVEPEAIPGLQTAHHPTRYGSRCSNIIVQSIKKFFGKEPPALLQIKFEIDPKK